MHLVLSSLISLVNPKFWVNCYACWVSSWLSSVSQTLQAGFSFIFSSCLLPLSNPTPPMASSYPPGNYKSASPWGAELRESTQYRTDSGRQQPQSGIFSTLSQAMRLAFCPRTFQKPICFRPLLLIWALALSPCFTLTSHCAFIFCH